MAPGAGLEARRRCSLRIAPFRYSARRLPERSNDLRNALTMDNPYLRFRGQSLSLNDYLAIDRTVLANERTLLSYMRTALTMLVIGGTCVKFFDSIWIEIVGVVFLLASLAVFIIGWRRYLRMRTWVGAALDQRTDGTSASNPRAA
jgi:putative membrane protein